MVNILTSKQILHAASKATVGGFLLMSFFGVSLGFSQDSELKEHTLFSKVLKEDCVVSVRLIRGLPVTLANEASGNEVSDVIDGGLQPASYVKDIEDQLQMLPFEKYELVDSQEIRLDYGSKADFHLKAFAAKLHDITVTPHLVRSQRVHVTVNWRNPDGEELLATRLRVFNNKCVILGTDGIGGSSTIASIRLNCVND